MFSTASVTTPSGFEFPVQSLQEFCRRNHIQEIAAFGSVLRADFGLDSDIDLLVEFEPEARVGFLTLGRLSRELRALLGRRVDLVPKAGLKPALRDGILGEALVLYAA